MARPEVLIVGAGATGLAAAVELARRGVAIRIVDRDPGPTPRSKAVGVSSHTLELLELSGVAARLLARGLRIRRVRVHDGDEPLGAIDFKGLPHRFNFLLSLPQSETEAILAERLGEHGVEVEWRRRLASLEQNDDGVIAELTGPGGDRHVVTADRVLGADGADSTVREQSGFRFEGYVHRREWSIADIEVDAWPYDPTEAQAFFGEDGDLAFVIPIGQGRHRAVSNTPSALAHIPGDFALRRTERTDRFHLPIRLADSFQRGRVFLAGDAAHVHSPLGARGMNLGIEDAVCFAGRFADGRLDGYSAERRPIGRRWIRFSERLLRAAESRNGAAVFARNLAIRVVGHAPWMQRPILQRVAGLVE
ncbi:FAD-dependent oxidoreductase [Phenylobacterium sp.]|uniref:FAD-dependent oxidoreductase n=1 Tax=Phenylobacterium sp. TaxID=1871053 RepID=UPI0025CD7973|nr:FAD-dependent oxidoreductase [Phenylobacterium sp.]